MSEQSDRAVGRKADVMALVLNRLQAHDELIERLESFDVDFDALPDWVNSEADLIMSAYQARVWFTTDQSQRDTAPPVLITVSYAAGSSDRLNMIEEKRHTIDVVFEFNRSIARSNAAQSIDALFDEIDAVMTAHPPGSWRSDGKTGGTGGDSPWDDELRRFIIGGRYEIIRRD